MRERVATVGRLSETEIKHGAPARMWRETIVAHIIIIYVYNMCTCIRNDVRLRDVITTPTIREASEYDERDTII